MAVDFEAIRRKLNQLSGQGNKRNTMYRYYYRTKRKRNTPLFDKICLFEHSKP